MVVRVPQCHTWWVLRLTDFLLAVSTGELVSDRAAQVPTCIHGRLLERRLDRNLVRSHTALLLLLRLIPATKLLLRLIRFYYCDRTVVVGRRVV